MRGDGTCSSATGSAGCNPQPLWLSRPGSIEAEECVFSSASHTTAPPPPPDPGLVYFGSWLTASIKPSIYILGSHRKTFFPAIEDYRFLWDSVIWLLTVNVFADFLENPWTCVSCLKPFMFLGSFNLSLSNVPNRYLKKVVLKLDMIEILY